MTQGEIERIEIREAGRGERALQEALRLAALEDAPDAFGEPYDAIVVQPESYWRRLTASFAGRTGQIVLLGCLGGKPVGFVYGIRSKERDEARLGGLWVEPHYRGQGVGRRLVQAIVDWAESKGFPSIGLWAPEHRPQVIALYRSLGFEPTGVSRALPGDEQRRIIEMRRTNRG
ncbi:MAG TPA: GNAT family N-acetyltransferase [Gammaproteobacteria bacterium]|nr:GNAT family N-acetyltransferase [Gammaproteobacteria bacterium]